MHRRQSILRFQLFSVENLESRLVMSAGSLAIIQPALIGSVEGGGLAWNWCGTTTSQSEEQAADVGAEIAVTNVAPELAASINLEIPDGRGRPSYNIPLANFTWLNYFTSFQPFSVTSKPVCPRWAS